VTCLKKIDFVRSWVGCNIRKYFTMRLRNMATGNDHFPVFKANTLASANPYAKFEGSYCILSLKQNHLYAEGVGAIWPPPSIM